MGVTQMLLPATYVWLEQLLLAALIAFLMALVANRFTTVPTWREAWVPGSIAAIFFAAVYGIAIYWLYGKTPVEPVTTQASTTIATALAGASVGAVLTYLLRRDGEKFAATMELLKTYHSDDLLKARIEAWDYLCGNYRREPKPYNWYFAGEGLKYNDEYKSLTRLIYFWYLVSIMRKQGELKENLTRDVLKYQFAHWKKALKPLFDKTREKPHAEHPEWLVMVGEEQAGTMDWLSKDVVVPDIIDPPPDQARTELARSIHGKEGEKAYDRVWEFAEDIVVKKSGQEAAIKKALAGAIAAQASGTDVTKLKAAGMQAVLPLLVPPGP